VGDTILSLNEIVLSEIDGGVEAWKTLFSTFATVKRRLVVERGPRSASVGYAQKLNTSTN
jgi:hypothetical protein